MQPVTRITNCRACRAELPYAPVFSLGEMPVVAFPEIADGEFLSAPIDLYECPRCDLVQLGHTVDPDLMFRKYWYRSGVTESMKAALRDVVWSAMRIVELSEGDSVCDIGANDGTLLTFYPDFVHRCGFEPALKQCQEAIKRGFTVLPFYFTREKCPPSFESKFKVITSCAMFYDLSDPGQFLDDVKWALAPDGLFVCQMNYLISMLKQLAVDNIEHEHLTYWSAATFQSLCAAHGMVVEKIETNEVNGGSIRFYCRKAEGVRKTQGVLDFIKDEFYYMGAFGWGDFVGGLDAMRARVRNCIFAARSNGQGVNILGASTRGLTLLHYLHLGKEVFGCAGERDPAKHGRFYGATGIPIVSEAEMRERCEVLLVLPYHFASEITSREAEFLAGGGELVFPLPRPAVIGHGGCRFL